MMRQGHGKAVRLVVALGTAGLLLGAPGAFAQQSDDVAVNGAQSARPEQVASADFASARANAVALPATSDATVDNMIAGTVRDPNGRPVAGVQLTVKNLSTDETLNRTSDASGAFELQNLAPGSYAIKAEKPGFRGAEAAVVLGISEQLHADVVLMLAATADDAGASTDASAVPASAAAPELASLESRIEQLESELASLKANPIVPPQSAEASAQNAAQTPPPVDEKTPFAYGDFTWLNGSPRNKKVAFDSPFFTPEVRFDTHYMNSFNDPIDHTLGGSTESFRSGEVQVEQISVGGDFHMDNVRGRILTMMGLFATTTPRNDASAGVGQWDARNAYRYVSEAYGGYHLDVQHGINIDAGIFVSYIGLFSYYNFDNWTYQPSYVSSNTPWFFNGLRIQWFPTNKLKIEPWFINGWQSYNKFNSHPGVGGQVLYMPKESLKFVFNNYFLGTDTLGNPDRQRFHTDDSVEVRYYNKPESDVLSKIAMSFTADFGCEYGGGVKCTGGDATTPSQYFAGWMAYNRFWFHKDLFAITPGGGVMTNPGRYLTLLPPINGADAISGSPYFPEAPGLQAPMWDATLNFQYMPKDFLTFWAEYGYRHSDVPYFSGKGGITPPGGNNGFPQYYACSTGASSGTADLMAAQAACGGGADSLWYPDLRTTQSVVSVGVLVKF